MGDPWRDRLYRITFVAAGVYNISFGLWTTLWPAGFFKLFWFPDVPSHLEIWQCLGMVLGLYGAGYLYAAFHLDRARPWIAIGLAGKVLGPIGWVLAVHTGAWPLRTFTLIVFNDLVWWLPFVLFLIDGLPVGARVRAAAPWACAGFNFLAAAAMAFLLRPGMEIDPDPARRAEYIAGHPMVWRFGWGLWLAAATSLLAFYAWWGARAAHPARLWAFGIAAAGLACDFVAESLLIGWMPDSIDALTRPAALLTGGAANGLYTIAGIVLTLATPHISGWLRRWAWAAWASGIALTVSVLLNHGPAMAVSTAALMILFCPWVAAVGWKLSRP